MCVHAVYASVDTQGQYIKKIEIEVVVCGLKQTVHESEF
jgi:hypothetical protein